MCAKKKKCLVLFLVRIAIVIVIVVVVGSLLCKQRERERRVKVNLNKNKHGSRIIYLCMVCAEQCSTFPPAHRIPRSALSPLPRVAKQKQIDVNRRR